MPTASGPQGVLYNTAPAEGGSIFDRIASQIDAASANREQLRGLAAGGVVSPDAVPGGGLMSLLTGNNGVAPASISSDAATPTATSRGVLGTVANAITAAPTQLGALFKDATQKYGLPPGYLAQTAAIESRFNPTAVSPTGAAGLFGFTKGTAAQYGLNNPTDPVASTDAAGRLAADNATSLAKSLGRPPTAGELYLAHQQGAAGAAALIMHPEAPAGKVLASIGADPSNITVNGGDPNAPAGAFTAKYVSRFGGAGQQPQGTMAYAGSQPAPAPGAITGAAGGPVPSRVAVAPAGGTGSAAARPQPQPGAQGDGSDAPSSTHPYAPPPTAGTDTTPTASIPGAPGGAAPPSPQPASQPPMQVAQNGTQPNAGGSVYSSIAPPPSLDQVKALIVNPATRALGLQLWQQAITPRTPIKVGKGETILGANGQPIFSSPETVNADQTVINPVTGQPLFTAQGNDNSVVQVGEDQYGNKVFANFNKRTGAVSTIAPVPGQMTQTQTSNPASAGLNGPDFLATLSPTDQAQVKAIAEGRTPPPQGQALRSPRAARLLDLVQQYDPSFEAGNALARNKVRLDFESGGTAQVITAGNTALQHLSDISDIVPQLGNYDSGIPGNNTVNALKNTVGQSGGGAVAVNKFRTAVGDFAGELTKFYRGTGGSEADINRVLEDLNPNKSPSQLKAGIQTQVALVQGKVNALQDRWRQGMGPSVAPFPIISRTTQDALTKAGLAPADAPNVSATPSSVQPGAGLTAQDAKPPVRITSPDQAKALPPGTSFMTPDGRIMVRH